MTDQAKTITILIAEDDADDRLLAQEALDRIETTKSVEFVENGEELMDYLLRRGSYSHLNNSPQPCLLIIDLNMPKKDGREAIKEIKTNPHLRQIPIIVFTTSKDPDDICNTYQLGINSYIAKPPSFEELTKIMKTLIEYWAEIVELPINRNGDFCG